MKEVEILYKLDDDKENVLNILSQFEYKGEKSTLDVYFYDPLREDLKLDANNRLNKCFRLRKKDSDAYLTYKIDYFDDGNVWLYSDEHEVIVSDYETAEKIIEHLGLKELIRVNNTKYIFINSKYEIILEEVDDLGLFLEVEIVNEDVVTGVNDLKQEIRVFVDELGIKVVNEMNIGKPEALLKKALGA